MQVTIIVDAFRAFTTASYVLEKEPATYILTTKSSVIANLTAQFAKPFFIGKTENNENSFSYHIPNSPTRVIESDIKGKHVFHRTAAGAKGILNAKGANLILAAAFTNADATVRTIQTLTEPVVSIIPMGHEGNTPSLEDTVCAKYIESSLKGTAIELNPYLPELKQGPGHYFFSDDQWQYPQEDFTLCLELRRVNFAIQADVKDDYAILTKYNSSRCILCFICFWYCI
jgi:2-phosphosulfolactate phosphatase